MTGDRGQAMSCIRCLLLGVRKAGNKTASVEKAVRPADQIRTGKNEKRPSGSRFARRAAADNLHIHRYVVFRHRGKK